MIAPVSKIKYMYNWDILSYSYTQTIITVYYTNEIKGGQLSPIHSFSMIMLFWDSPSNQWIELLDADI